MKNILALFTIAVVLVAFSGCSQKAAGPEKGTNGTAKPDLGKPGSAVDMHDESKGKSKDSKPAPTTADSQKPAPAPASTQQPAAKGSKPESKPAPAPAPAKKAEKTDAKKGDPVNDKTDDKDEEEQK